MNRGLCGNGEQQRRGQQNAERVDDKAERECETNHTHVTPPPERQGRDHGDHLSANLIPPRRMALGERRESESTHPHLN